MSPRTQAFLAASLAAASILSAAPDFAAARLQVLALGKLAEPPARLPAEGFAKEDDLEPIFFEGLPWNGKATRVFGWLGLPPARGAKVPGIVLVHGGGGTAFKEWVSKWTERGFAAISIAVEGQTDQPEDTPPGARRSWKRHAWAGPARDLIYADSAEPLPDQWMYHAVADTVLANSLLRSLPEVDPEKVGVMGISWGGVIASTVIGIDPRFAFAIPTYGVGHQFDAENQWGTALGENELYREVWDPMVRMERVRMPVLWLSWPGEMAFPLNCQAACYRASRGSRMVALIPGMGHGHRAGWIPPDSYAFADSVVRTGKPWLAQMSAGLGDGRVRVEFTASKALEGAMLIRTRDTGLTGARNWAEAPASLEKEADRWLVTADLPDGATAWFVNVRSGDLTGSSDYQEAP